MDHQPSHKALFFEIRVFFGGENPLLSLRAAVELKTQNSKPKTQNPKSRRRLLVATQTAVRYTNVP